MGKPIQQRIQEAKEEAAIRTKLEAIAHIEKSMIHNPAFREQWLKYLELIVLDETGGWKIKDETRTYLAKRISQRVLGLFDTGFWAAQENDSKFIDELNKKEGQ